MNVPATERERTVVKLWAEVNRIANETEDERAIRNLIAEAGIHPDIHTGVPADDFTPLMVAEWVLGQWADMIDAHSPFMNMALAISEHQYEIHPWT